MKVGNLNEANQLRCANATWLTQWEMMICASCNGHKKEDLEIWDLAKLVAVIDTKVEQMTFTRHLHGERQVGVSGS